MARGEHGHQVRGIEWASLAGESGAAGVVELGRPWGVFSGIRWIASKAIRKIPVARRPDNDALAEIGVPDALTRLERPRHRHQEILGW